MDREQGFGETPLHERVYDALREALMMGRFAPGQKLTIREVGDALGASMTPVRQALSRLVEQGALEDSQGKSLRVPLMTVARWLEIRDMRLALEGLAIERAAARITVHELAELRRMSLELVAARQRDDVQRDRSLIAQFQLAAYAASGAPLLIQTIRSLWLLTGPYLNLIFPDYVKTVPRGWRGRLCAMLEAHDAAGARAEIERDVREALDYVASLADEDGVIQMTLRKKSSIR